MNLIRTQLFIIINIISVIYPVSPSLFGETKKKNVECKNNEIKTISSAEILNESVQVADDILIDNDILIEEPVNLTNISIPEEQLNTDPDTRKLQILQSGISIALSRYFNIPLSDDPKFFKNECDFVEIRMPYKNVSFKEYAPKNFIYLRMLYDEKDNYTNSFKNPTKDKGLIKEPGSGLLYTENKQFMIQPLHEADINPLLSKLNMYFSHFCNYPESFLPAISGLYSLKFNSDVYYYMIIVNFFPENQEGNTNMYFINGVDIKDKINESDSLERLREKDFEKAFPSGLGLPPAINKQFIKILNKDSLFLTKFGVYNYCLVIFTKKQPPKTVSFLPTNIQSCKKGVIINPNGDKLNTFITIGVLDLFDKHTRLMIIEGKVNNPPKKYQKQYMSYIKKKVFTT